MTPAAALGLGWATLAVIALASRLRPAPGRIRALLPAAGTGSPGGSEPASPVERVGGLLLRVARRPADPTMAQRLGWAMVAAVAFLPVLPVAAVPAAAVAWAVPAVRRRRVQRRRLAAVAADLPDVVDLLMLGVGSGLTVYLAVTRVAARASGPLAAELARVVEEVRMGRRMADALDDLPRPDRAGEAVRPLVGALVASERYGAPLVGGLERLADEVRRDRRRRAEEAARKVPVKLLFPLVTCTLPAFGLLTIAPLIASALRSLHL